MMLVPCIFASLVPGCSPNGCSFLVWREHVTLSCVPRIVCRTKGQDDQAEQVIFIWVRDLKELLCVERWGGVVGRLLRCECAL